jgi:hypothetical protein
MIGPFLPIEQTSLLHVVATALGQRCLHGRDDGICWPHDGRGAEPSVRRPLVSQQSLINGPFFIAGTLKIAYDLRLYRAFRSLTPPEELTGSAVIVASQTSWHEATSQPGFIKVS